MNPNYRKVGISNASDCKLKQASIVLPSRTIVLDGPQLDKRWYANEDHEDRNGVYIPVLGLGRVEYQVKVTLDGCPQQFAKAEMVSSGKYIDLWLVSGTSGGEAL
ncbi:MAG: hypothetical protein Cons2KO_26330 [Congregibacter sp.]